MADPFAHDHSYAVGAFVDDEAYEASAEDEAADSVSDNMDYSESWAAEVEAADTLLRLSSGAECPDDSDDDSEIADGSGEDTDHDFIVSDDNESCAATAGSDSGDSASDADDEGELGCVLVNGHREYEIERILDHRIFSDASYFLVRWLGYTSDEDLWLPASELRHAREVLQEYKDRVGLV